MKLKTKLEKNFSKIWEIFPEPARSRYLVNGGIALLLIIATVILNWRMIRDGISGHGDLKWYLPWLQHFSRQLAEGIWYPRWLAGTNYGYGSPTFVFQPPLVFYLGSLLKLTGIETQDTVVILFSLGIFLAGLSFYIYGRDKWGFFPSFSGALVYMTAPYMAFDIHWRGGIVSIFVQAWIPLIWWLTEQSLFYSKWRLGLALAWTGLALTHAPSLLICSFIWLFNTLFYLLKVSWKSVLKTILSAGIGSAMASIFLLPAILEQAFINIDSIKKVSGGISENLIGSAGIPLSTSNWIGYIFIHQSLAIVVLGIIAFASCRERAGTSKAKQEIYYWLIFALILVFFMSYLSEPIWQASSTLQKVQFPWRLLNFFSFVGAALAAVTVGEILKLHLRFKLFFSLLILIIILTNFGYSYKLSRKFIALRNPGRANIEHLKYIQTILDDPYTEKLRDYPDYRPVLKNGLPSPPTPVLGQPRISVISGKATIESQLWASYSRIFNVRAERPSTIRIRTYYYPAWHLYVNGKPQAIAMSDEGTINFELGPGSYQVELRYQWTPAFSMGIIASLFSVVVFIFLKKLAWL